MENNRIHDVIVHNFTMKKEKICHISPTFHTVSKSYWKYNQKIFMIVMATKLEQTSLIESR